MKIQTDCIPCILTMTLKAVKNLSLTPGAEKDLFTEILKIQGLRGLDWDQTSPAIIETVMNIIMEKVHDPDPFRREKIQLNAQALALLPVLEKMVDASAEPLYTAAKIAILGNSMDIMMPGGLSSLETFIREKLEAPLSREAFDPFCRQVSKARQIVYLTDNAGEIAFDRLFIQTLKKRYDVHVTVVVRSLPTLNDATLKEAMEAGLDQVATLMENGIDGPFPGTSLKRCSPAVRSLARESDLIISKGGGNFDSLSEEVSDLETPVFFMLLSKCGPLNAFFKTRLHQPVMARIQNQFAREYS
ncbi:MAG: ARMT1-like domain-containing protein [Desulfobacteraceae bacterium]|nr:ARMT1-like domain-containing protein [Desulfobacteraceae bacterium]